MSTCATCAAASHYLVSRSTTGRPADGASHSPALSADARHVAFVSRAGNLTAHDRNDESDVYVHDIAAGATTLVSVTAKGEAADAAAVSRPSQLMGSWCSINHSRPIWDPAPDAHLAYPIRIFCLTCMCSIARRVVPHASAARAERNGGRPAWHQRSTSQAVSSCSRQRSPLRTATSPLGSTSSGRLRQSRNP